MSRILSLLFFLTFAGTAWGFEYKIDEASLLSPSPFQLYQIGQIFSKQGYRSFTDVNLTSAGFAFDRVFSSYDWNSSLLLKAGLRVPLHLRGKIIEESSLGIQIFHFEHDGTPYMLMAMNISNGELREIVRPWLMSDSSVKWSWLFPQAHAKVCSASFRSPHSSLQSTAETIEAGELLRGIGRCGVDVLSGAAGSVGDTLNFFKKLVTDPVALWGETKESFQQLKHFVTNIQSELSGAFAGFRNLSTQEKVDMACMFTGEILGVALQAAVGGGALAKTLPLLTLKIKSVSSLLGKLGKLEVQGIKFPNRSWMMREAMSCVL